jgi:hypothetical protein
VYQQCRRQCSANANSRYICIPLNKEQNMPEVGRNSVRQKYHRLSRRKHLVILSVICHFCLSPRGFVAVMYSSLRWNIETQESQRFTRYLLQWRIHPDPSHGGGDPFLKKSSPTFMGGDGVKIGKLQRKKNENCRSWGALIHLAISQATRRQGGKRWKLGDR